MSVELRYSPDFRRHKQTSAKHLDILEKNHQVGFEVL